MKMSIKNLKRSRNHSFYSICTGIWNLRTRSTKCMQFIWNKKSISKKSSLAKPVYRKRYLVTMLRNARRKTRQQKREFMCGKNKKSPNKCLCRYRGLSWVWTPQRDGWQLYQFKFKVCYYLYILYIRILISLLLIYHCNIWYKIYFLYITYYYTINSLYI